ncbi:universal stress protein [Caulobacter sp. NIBR2454]|uniref:universal stress protein n=1 Tax=Caulobacter sp. NIBR2454 TaxID=3015996 RepID=UPI0022B72D59|nr:universal stress protein [Caulobacter sp. NIBR2454]
MTFSDILIAVEAYPFEAPVSVWPRVAALAKALGTQATALGFELRITPPKSRLGQLFISMDVLAGEEEERSRTATGRALSRLQEEARLIGLPLEVLTEKIHIYDEAQTMARHARTRDVTLLPVGASLAGDLEAAEAVIFGSGRPVVVVPEAGRMVGALDRIAIAWDGSRAASRAMADALPLLVSASEVRLVCIPDDKALPHELSPAAAQRNLERHGISSEIDMLMASGQSPAERLRDYLRDREIDLLVMGAFGHSRVREFILGGMTASMLADPPVPILLAH